MHHYVNSIEDTKGNALIGFFVRCVDSTTGLAATLYADTSLTPILSVSGLANAAQVNTDGNADFYIPLGTYHLDIYATDGTTFIRRIQNIPMVEDVLPPSAAVIGLFTGASSQTIGSSTTLVQTTGYSTLDVGAAVYAYDATVDSAYVAANPKSSFVSANGLGFRLSHEQDLALEMFGAIRNSSTSGSKTANNAALTAALAYDPIVVDTYYGPSRTIKLLEGDYHFSQSYFNVKKSVALMGAGGWASVGGYCATRFIGPLNWKGLIFQSYNTIDETVEGSPTTSAAGSLVVGIEFVGNDDTGANWNNITGGQGIWARTCVTVLGCKFYQLYDGWKILAVSGGGGATEGQASGCFGMANSFIQNRHDGLHIEGADANAGRFIHHNYIANGRFGVYDWAFLGNTHDGGHWRENGARTDFFNVSAQCYYGGNLYYVGETARPNPQAAYASDPDTTDTALRVGNPSTNSLWTKVGAGSAGLDYPDFSTFTGTFQKGGPLIQRRGRFGGGAYSEGAQPPYHVSSEVFVDPGLDGAGVLGYGVLIEAGQLTTTTPTTLGQTRVAFDGGASGNILNVHNSGALAAGPKAEMRLSQGFEADGITPASVAGFYGYFSTSSPATAEATVVLRSRTPAGAGAMTDRVMWDSINAQYRPTTTATWDLGGTTDWRNLTLSGVIKIGGTQVIDASRNGTFANASATGTIGYATGAGGTVTQATSRTTSVTLNKACGQITLFSAAGSATWATFTVTNSVVATTDVIRLNQASGTDKYMLHVTHVAAGSFDVSFATTGGTTTEQPVLNFAVIKAVAA